MGMESFFINLKLTDDTSWSTVSAMLYTGNHDVKILTGRKHYIIKKKISDTLKVVVDNIILVEYNEKNADISLQACFSCFERARNLMVKIVHDFSSSGIINYVYYGSEIIDLEDFGNLAKYINIFTEKKKIIFDARYPNVQKDLLPEEFYKYIINHKYPNHD